MKRVKQIAQSVSLAIKKGNERGSRENLIEELFYDFNRSRVQVYKFNFIRGIFFGAGTLIGGTVVVGLFVWILSLLGNIIPPLGSFFDAITASLEAARR